ncbi:hypothetical protein [Paraliomyxa miuraensis]|uniref:hypothetical protein n=1 Tax=Paraliomyxa miuraensis TaxID=376150 RepID=UPI00225BE504|nr:hypothetical protein [Paraliomyxa miuraensis]MCX4239773.1 hypothetical protein [Paraliomyxa miuraensis]
MTTNDATAERTLDPWHWLETRDDDGVIIRVARTWEDAEAARRLIRDAWAVEDGERYFYGAFDDAKTLFETVIVPSTRSGDLRELDAICVLVDAVDEHGRTISVGTFSLVLDHEARTVEIGRGAVASAWQRRQLPARALRPMQRLLGTIPEYAAITDATTLARGAKATADALGLHTVALHPSNFTVQANAVAPWHARLHERRGAALAQALLRRSDRTGLGRFTTSHHCRLPRELRPPMPVLTAAQMPFFAHTCRVSQLHETLEGAPTQRARLRKTKISDRIHTATRTVVDPHPGVDVRASVTAAAAEGFETLVVQVPCDAQHRPLCERLELTGAILGGVFVDAHGCWRASYTLPTTEEHAAQVRRDLAVVAEHEALDGEAAPLLRLVHAYVTHTNSTLEQAS